MIQKIIFGKQNKNRIVSIEPSQETCELFIQNKDGSISSEFVPNKYWLLSQKALDSEFIRLKGGLFYQWGKQYTERSAFLRDRQIYKREETFSIYNPKEAFAVKDGYSCFLDMEPKEVSLLSFDLETTTLDPYDSSAKILCISTFYRNSNESEMKLFAYDEYKNEGEMIKAFCSFIKNKNPSILLGHNIMSFDLKYLDVIASKFNISLDLGRDGSNLVTNNYESKFRVDGNRDLHYNDVRVYGREIIDTYFLAIKSDIRRKYNSYGLKPIIEQEGWVQAGRIFYDSSKIRQNYLIKEEWYKIKEYCKFDALDAVTLFDKFIPPFFYMCQSVAKGSFQSLINTASGSQLNSIMIRAYLQDAHSLPKADEQTEFEGAISLGIPNVYSNVLKIDINSLYPSLMLQYNIFPLHKDPKKYFPFLVKYFREERLKNKKLAKETQKEYYSHLEQSQKIMSNSIYGFMGAPGLLFNYVKGAAEVTRKGREVLQFTIKWATGETYELPKKNG